MIHTPVTPKLGDFFIDESVQLRWAPVIVWFCYDNRGQHEPSVAERDTYHQGDRTWMFLRGQWVEIESTP